MKYSNKKDVIQCNFFIITLLLILLSIVIIDKLLNIYFINNYIIILISLCICSLILGLIKKRIIIEYDVSGDVLSIRNYHWYAPYNKSRRPLFEMPKKDLISFEIIQVFLWRDLYIKFINEDGKNRIIKINISSFSQKQAHRMHIELSTFLVTGNYHERRVS